VLMRTGLIVSILLIVLMSSSSLALSPVAAITPPTLNLLEWQVPTNPAHLGGISMDSSGRVWFTENNSANKLGMLDPVSNNIYEWSGFSGPDSHNLVVKRAGAFGGTSNRVYFAESVSNQIAFFDNVTGYVNWLTEWGSLTGRRPVNVAVDNLGNVWFTETGSSPSDEGYIGELTGIITPTDGSSPKATLNEWQLPGYSSGAFFSNPCKCQPWGIYVNQTVASAGVSPDTYVWFTEKTGGTNGAGAVGRLQVSTNELTIFDLGVAPLTGVHGPTDITVDSAGNVYWVNSAPAGNSVSFLATAAFTYKEFAVGTTSSTLLAPARDLARSALWAVEYAGNNIAYLDLSSTITNTQLAPVAAECTIKTGSNPIPTGQPAACLSNGETSKSVTSTRSSSVGTIANSAEKVTNLNAPTAQPLGYPTGPINNVYEYGLLSANAAPYAMFLDPNENLWITESGNNVNRIAEIQIPADFNIAATLTSPLQPSIPIGGSATYSISVTPSPSTPGEQTPVTLSVNAPAALSASFSTSPGTPPFTSTLTISTTGSTPSGTYSMSITGTSTAGLTHSVSITLTVTSEVVTTSTTTTTACGFDYQITADQTSKTIQEGSVDFYQLHVLQTCPTVSQLPVTLTVTNPSGVTSQLTANDVAPPFDTQLQVQVALDAPVTSSGTITVTGFAPGGLSHSLDLTLDITAVQRDFSINGPGSTSLYQSSRETITLSVASIGVFSGPVQFTVPEVSGLTGSISPNPVDLAPAATVSSTLEIVADKSVAPGTYTLTVTGAGTTPAGPVSHDFPVTVTVVSGLPCLIATATFGSPLAPEVQFLRDFRDQQILHTFAGSNFMAVFNAWYYSFSPSVAGYENLHPSVKPPMQYFLMPLLGSLHASEWTYASMAVMNPEIAALTAGLVASSLIGLLYLGLPFAAAVWIARRKVLAKRANVAFRLAKFFAASVGLAVVLFAVSELFAVGIAMMVASASIVLLGLAAGCMLPVFALVERVYKS
jgi:streptogramin lyase